MSNARRDRRRKFRIELLETRQMLAADYLYSLTPRPGVAVDGFGWSQAASEDYHVVGNPYTEELPENGFVGEVQVHDADTGALLRTIANPDPEDLYRFGYSVDVSADWILVGAVGSPNPAESNVSASYSDQSGRAYLFDASTGDLLFRFDGTFMTGRGSSENYDQFGNSVSIDGNYVVVGAPGNEPYDTNDDDAGHVYIFSAVTGALLQMIENPEPEASNGGLDFGYTVSISDGRLAISNPRTGTYGTANANYGKSYVYDAATGNLLQTLLAPNMPGGTNFGFYVAIDGNVVAVSAGESSGDVVYIFDATTGNVTQKLLNRNMSDLYENQVATRVSTIGTPTTLGNIIDAGSGAITSVIIPPPGFVVDPSEVYWSNLTLFGDRLLVGGLEASGPDEVLVYEVVSNAPPTDIALSGNSIAENSTNGTVVGALTATDPTPGEMLTFSLQNSAGGRFTVSGTNLVVADGSLLNFEANTSHSVTVRVTDSVGNTYDEAFTINVTDVNEVATLISLTPNSESENTTNGAVVGVLSSNDPDASDPETFELLEGAGGRFEQVGLQIRVANASLLDFETASSHQINVRVTDSAAHVLEQLVTINITDFNYTPTDIGLSGNQVREGSVHVLKNPAANRPNGFGTSLASSETRLVVADQDVVGPADYAGRVLVYDAVSNVLLATLSNPTGLPGDRFGQSIATAGNYVVVGAGGEDVTGVDSGRAYVFDATTGALLHVLSNPDQTASSVDDEFGAEVAIFGSTIAVSSSADATAASAGAVHLFDAVSGNLLTTILSPEPADAGFFGSSISMTDDRLLIGAKSNSATGFVSGRAYLYNYNSVNGSTSLVTTIDNPTPGSFDSFGFQVVITPTVLAIAAPGDDAGAENSGVVHLFSASTGALLATIQNPTPALNDLFGASLAVAGDRIIVGARDDSGGDASGQVYVFSASTGTLLGTIANPTPAADDDFGRYLTANSTHIVVSAYGDDSNGTDAGLVYVFDLPVAEVVGQLTGSDPEPAETFTWSLLDNAGGRFGIDGNNLIVADPMLLNFEIATSHDVTVQATDSGGLTVSKTFTIQVTDVAESTQFVNGTSGDDSYAVLYSSTDVNTGTATVQVSTNDGPVTTIGTFPMSLELYIDGLAGSDSVQVIGTNGSDTLSVPTANTWIINSSMLFLSSIETRVLGGGGGNDQYFFDVDSPLGMIRLVENAVVGIDRLDFSPTTTVAVAVNLSLNGPQAIHPTNLSLDLAVLNTIENLIGGSMNDVLIGNTLANTITGGPGNDAITAAGGNDSLYGGTGDDEFIFNAVTSAEADYIAEYFDQGTDTITFASMPINVVMNLGTLAVQTVHVGRTLSLSSAITFENLIGGAGNDSLTGNTLGNTLTGNAGNDQLTGLGGSDTLAGGPGFDSYGFTSATSLENDVIIEADNLLGDTISFGSLSIGVTLDLSSTAVQPVHTNRTLQLSGTNAIESIIGGSGNDVLTGNAAPNGMTGGGGNDVLDGRGGNDGLFGQTGNDTYVFSPAAAGETDSIQEAAGEGADTIDFGLLTTVVTIDLSSTAVQFVHQNRSLGLSSGQTIENIIGGTANDELTGNTLANTITGGPGDDTINGGGGNDLHYGGTGNDTFVFDAVTSAEVDFVAEYSNQGTDTISFFSLSIGVALGLNTNAIQTVHTNRTIQLNHPNAFENLIGGSGDDTLNGNDQANTLTGNAGSDQLNGFAGDDLLLGNEGNDILFDHLGSDLLHGGAGDDTYNCGVVSASAETDNLFELPGEGSDTVFFGNIISPITFSLALSIGQPAYPNRTVQLNSGSTFESLFGGAGSDLLSGNDLANSIFGGSGNDALSGGGGNDSLYGQQGNDTYIFAAASSLENDFVLELPNQGTDTLDFSALSIGVSLGLNTNSIQAAHTNRTVQLNQNATFENVIGGSGNDTLIGNSLANILVGNNGSDSMLGGDGRDILIGGPGGDTLNGGLADDVLIAGRTLSDASIAQLIDLQTQWMSANTYSTRITNLRAGVGASLASLQAGINVLNDSGAIDTLTGAADTDWYFRALDDLISDLFGGEIEDLL